MQLRSTTTSGADHAPVRARVRALAPVDVRPTLALAAGAGVAGLVAVCVVAASAPGSLIPADASSLYVDHAWGRLFVRSLDGAFVAYLAGLWLVRRRGSRVLAVAAVAVVVQTLPLVAPLMVSTDAWSYWDYARTAQVHRADPYTVPPSAFPRDPAYAFMGGAWHGTTSAYGPAFTLATEPLAAAVGPSPSRAAWSFKLLGAIGVLTATALAGLLATRTAFAVAFVGWNPLLAVDFAGGGHNDAWMAALVLAALALAATGRRRLSAAAWAVGVFVKWVPLLLLPPHLLARRARGEPTGLRALATALLAGGVAASLAFGPHWLRAAAPLAHTADHGSRFALPRRLGSLGIRPWLAVPACAVVLAGAYAWVLRSAARGRARLGLTAGLVLLLAPYVLSWYTVWAVPLAAAEEDGAAQLLSLGLCGYLLRQGIRT